MSDFKIKVPGTNFIIESDSIYEVDTKLDPNGPEEFKKFQTTKPINPNLTNTFTPPFNMEMEVWDLGFDENSPCLRGMSSSEIKTHLVTIQKWIVGPIEKIKGKGYLNSMAEDVQVDRENSKSLDNHRIEVGIGQIFDTNRSIDLLNLYIAILAKELAPKEEEYSQFWDNAQFSIENKKQKIGLQQKKTYQANKAVAEMFNLLEGDRKTAISILDYVGVKISETSKDQAISSIFTAWLNSGQRSGENAKFFIESVNRLTGKEGNEELYLYKMLKDLTTKGEVKFRNGQYLMDGEVLGGSLKEIANTANLNEKLKEAITSKAILEV